MIMNVMEIMKNNNAYKTIKLRDLLKVDNSVLDILQMKTPEQTQKFQRKKSKKLHKGAFY